MGILSLIRRRELVVLVVFGALILMAGVYPAAVLDLTRVASEGWIRQLAP